MNLDTVFIEPDEHTFCLVWRGNTPLSELPNAEIDQVSISTRTVNQPDNR